MSANGTITQALREAAAQVLSEEKVGVVIGYGRDDGQEFSTPLFVRKAEEAERLILRTKALEDNDELLVRTV